MASNFTTLAFWDDLKEGWGVKYGPTLQGCGLDDLDDAQDLSEGDLDGAAWSCLAGEGCPCATCSPNRQTIIPRQQLQPR
jgi:hypothetical protein